MRQWPFQLISGLLALGIAFPSQAASTQPVRDIVILAVLSDAKRDADLESKLTEYLKLDGHQVTGSGQLSADEQTCRERDCMSAIMQKRAASGWLLRADIETMPSSAMDGQGGAPTRKVWVSGFTREGMQSWSASAFCAPCTSSTALLATLEKVANQTLKGPPESLPNTELTPATPVGPATTSHPSWSRARIATVATLGGASVVTLAVGGGLAWLDGRPSSSQCLPSNPTLFPADPNQCVIRTLPGIGGAVFAAGAALAIAAVTLAITWPHASKPPKQRSIDAPPAAPRAAETTNAAP